MQSGEKDLLAIISSSVHDMKAPLTSISGFAEAILDGTVPQEKREHYLSVIKEEAERLREICEELLSASRIEAGAEVYDMKPFDICECARRVLISLERAIENKKLSIFFDAEKDRMLAIGDKSAIQRVLYNICENAVKFSYEKGSVRISLRYTEDNISVRIENSGEKIDDEMLSEIFSPFTRRGVMKGSGLGMYISKKIIDSHGGRIYAESEEGKGSAFTFILNRG